MAGVEYRILGSVEATRDGEQLSLGGAKQRALLAILLVHANRVVTTDLLVEALWPEKPPGKPNTAIHGYVSHLRRVLAPDRPFDVIVTEPVGYRLPVDPSSLDMLRLDALFHAGREALEKGDARAAKLALDAAVSLFRGAPLAEFTYDAWASGEIGRLEELRLACLEEKIEADLALGRHGELVGELEALIAQHPLRERLRGQLMTALYRSGRQSEALTVYQVTRDALVGELGIEPSPTLHELHRQVLIQDPALAAPLGPAANERRVQLPTPASSFLGRGRELQEVGELLRREDVRLLTLTGPGGTGKTRLALEAATQAVDSFRDGVYWIGLSSLRDAALVTETIAQTLGAKDVLAQYIGERELLLVLDNLEQVIESAPELSTLLTSCRNLTLMVTSRELLRVRGEVEYPVPPLSEAEAVSLFCERGRTQPSADVAVLCSHLDSLPLAVELAAARVRALSPAQILDRLAQRLDLLKGGRDADPRQLTLRATIEWSYDLLSEEEQRLFVRLSVFAGGCTLEAAEGVADADVDTMLSLVEKSLLRHTNERYWMLETIRDYADERLAGSGESDAIRRRHADFCVALAERAEPELRGPNQAAWLLRLDVEHDNFRAALAWLLGADSALALRLTASLGRFWLAHDHLGEGRRWFDESFTLAMEYDVAVRAKALKGAGNLAVVQGDYAAATSYYEESLALRQGLNDDAGIAGALANLALVAAETRELDRARDLLDESLALRRTIGDKWGIAMCLNNMGLVALYARDFERAVDLYDESLVAFRELGDEQGIADSLLCKGRASLQAGDSGTAVQLLRESLELSSGLGDRWAIAECLEGMAAVTASSGESRRAAVLFGAAEALREEIGAPHSPSDEPWHVEFEMEVRRVLGDEADALARDEGRTMALDDAIAHAREVVAPYVSSDSR